MALKDWNKQEGHNEWIDNDGKQISISYVLNGEHKGEYDVTIGSNLTERGTRKILLEKHFKSKSQSLAFAKQYMRSH